VNGTTDALEAARAIVRADLAVGPEPHLRRLADRLFTAIQKNVVECEAVSDTPQEVAALEAAQARAATLRELSEALHAIAQLYATIVDA
jgi:hypothetical protein